MFLRNRRRLFSNYSSLNIIGWKFSLGLKVLTSLEDEKNWSVVAVADESFIIAQREKLYDAIHQIRFSGGSYYIKNIFKLLSPEVNKNFHPINNKRSFDVI